MRGLWPSLALLEVAAVGVTSFEHGDSRLAKRDGSSDGQVMCWWNQPSAALIRDTIYVDGGNLQYVNASQVSSTGILQSNYPAKPFTYTLNLTSAFTVGQNSKTPATFGTIPKTYQNLYDGFMAANDYYYILYGGYIRWSSSITSIPDADEVAEYQAFLQGPQRVFTQGYIDTRLTGGVTRYVGSGAGVNVRELNMSYYYSGLRSPTWGEIRGNGLALANVTANTTSNQLISVDMSTEVSPTWKNTTAASPARGRANPEMVYVPAGNKGALVVVGGVLYPDWMDPAPTQDQALQRERTAKSFLESVDVYDIETGNWYLQNTTGDTPPNGMTQFCATLASSSDGSSHQIYVYGGYSGNKGDGYSDDVYILTLPAFQWIKAYSGSNSGLKSHKCLKVYPDQMFIIGGANANYNCNKNGIVSVFNLNTLSFQNSYDPTKYSEYAVPSAVYKAIGGDSKGGATKTADWADSDLRAMFQSNTPSATAVTWYPYKSAAASNSGNGGSGTPKYVWPLVGTLIGVLLVVIIACLVFFIIRRRKRKQYEQEFSEGSGPSFSADKASGSTRLQNWLGGITPGLSGTDAAPSTIGDHSSEARYGAAAGSGSVVSPLSGSVSGSIVPTNSSAYGDYYAAKEDHIHELPATQEVAELDSSEVSSPEGTVTQRPAPGHLPTVEESLNAPVPNTPIDPVSPAEGLEVSPERVEIKPDTPVEKNFGADVHK